MVLSGCLVACCHVVWLSRRLLSSFLTSFDLADGQPLASLYHIFHQLQYILLSQVLDVLPCCLVSTCCLVALTVSSFRCLAV